MRSEPGRSPDRRGLSNPAGFRRRVEKLTDRTVPDAAIHGRPGYHRSHGETTKRAPEASVFTCHNLHKAGWGRRPMRTDSVRVDVPDRCDGLHRCGDDDLLTDRHPVSPGVEHAT